jgi:RNA polymerase sigma-70 factor (ECF subfamily)
VDRHEPISPEALRLLVASHAEFLSFLERHVGSRELAQELLQQAFVRGIERGGAIHDDERAVAWFYRLLRNAVVDHARRSGTADRALRRWADELEASQHVDESLHRTVCTCVSKLVGTLKPEYATALQAVDVEGKPVGDFAKQAGISANNAAVRLHRARAALGERVRASCGTCASDGSCLDCSCV